MNPLFGNLTADQREALLTAADSLALLPLTGATDLRRQLRCLSHTRTPNTDDIRTAITSAHALHKALLFDTNPDRWLEDVSGFDADTQNELVCDLTEQRRIQAAHLAHALTVLSDLDTKTPALHATN